MSFLYCGIILLHFEVDYLRTGDMKRIQQALCTQSTDVLRRLLVCSVGMAAAAVPVSRVTWSQYRTLYNQLRCQGWTTQGRRCFISTSSVWATGEGKKRSLGVQELSSEKCTSLCYDNMKTTSAYVQLHSPTLSHYQAYTDLLTEWLHPGKTQAFFLW